MRLIDHLVYCVPELEKACSYLAQVLGVEPSMGGRHLTKGTKNAVLNLGNACYLEVLALDQDNEERNGPRWMGIDLISSPRVTRWSLKSQTLFSDSEVLKSYNPRMGEIDGGSRELGGGGILEWQMTLPLAEPIIDLVPFVTQWPVTSIHPTERMENICSLEYIRFTHPEPKAIQEVFNQLEIENRLLKGAEPEIRIGIRGPKGFLELK